MKKLQSFLDLLGRSLDDVEGLGKAHSLHPAVIQKAIENIATYMEGGGRYTSYNHFIDAFLTEARTLAPDILDLLYKPKGTFAKLFGG